MGSDFPILILALIGAVAGVAAGMFGIGGGVLIVPGLVYLLGFSQHRATGTSLAILLPPVGLLAVLEYYRHNNVDIKAAVVVGLALFLGAWVGAFLANKISGPYLKLIFGLFVVVMGLYLIYNSLNTILHTSKPA